MKRRFKKSPAQKSIAAERIEILFKEAEGSSEHANRYVELARKIGMKYRVRISKEYKRKYCKHCHAYLKMGKNCKVRLNQNRFPHLVIHCEECGEVMRIPYKK
ncbi:MAG: ribonuclease P [archaeon]